MKTITTMLAVMGAMVAVSCQNDDLSGSDGPNQNPDAAYISIAIDSPSTRASLEGTTGDGTSDENKIFSLALLTFDQNYDYLGFQQVYLQNGDDKFKCSVAPDARRFVAVVNPNAEILAAIDQISSLNQSQFNKVPPITLTAASVSTENYKTNSSELRGFVMANSGVKNPAGLLPESLVSISHELSTDIDNPTDITIPVDRLVAKFEYSVNSAFDTNTRTKFGTETTTVAEGKVLGVALTATNKATNLYSTIMTDQLTNNNIYRKDHNMAVGQGVLEPADIIAVLNANFNWLKNGDENTDQAFVAPNATIGSVAETPEYVLENTCEPLYSNSNNLTQAIVKAQYNPMMSNGNILPLGTSWFKMYTSIGTLYLTFDDVVALYNGTYAGFTATPETIASMDVQLNKILGSTGKTWKDSDVSLTLLNDPKYGGYKAATVDSESDCVLQFYQNAENYYDIFIQHDDAQQVAHLGRWGMVRNNSYTMDITGIQQEGLPYIPDPTDDKIVDPDNKDPQKPEPADKLNTYIAVSISVNKWVLWTQSSPLL